MLFKVSNDRVSTSVSFDPDSTELANIIEFYGVESPKELEGFSLPILRSSIQDDEQTVLLVPHNTSLAGIVRFGVHNRVEDLVEKGTQETLIDNGFLITSGFVCMFSLAFLVFGDNFGLDYIRMISYLVGGLLTSQFVGCVLYRILMLILSVISTVFKSDFYEIEM